MLVWASLLAAVGTGTAHAQQAPAPSEPFYKRFSFGARGSVLINPLLQSQTITEATTSSDPPMTTTWSNDSKSKRYGGGPSFHIRLADKVGLNIDVLYRRSGYDVSVVTKEQDVTDSAGKVTTGATLSQDYERTRADYWDIPVLARYYTKYSDQGGARPYFTGGAAYRTVSAIKTFREHIDEDKLKDTSTRPAEPANKGILGAVVGGGFQFRDEVGLKIEFEVRYTRWFRRTFDASPTVSNLNQAEGLVAFTF